MVNVDFSGRIYFRNYMQKLYLLHFLESAVVTVNINFFKFEKSKNQKILKEY